MTEASPSQKETTPYSTNQTLYVNNLNEKIKKPELKRCLYALFGQYGAILDVVALKTKKMRGQAFIVYKDLTSAVAAMRALQGYPFFGKSLRIQFCKTQSKAVIDFEQYVMEPARRQHMAQQLSNTPAQ